MADSKTNKSTKKTATAGKTAAKNLEKPSTIKAKAVTSAASKAVSANTATKGKTASTKAAPAEAAKLKTKQDAKPAPTPQKAKEKSSGSGMAFLALLCALGALGLSGFNFYQQHMSPNKVQTQDALLSGVNGIKANVTEFGTVVSGLQQDVEAFKSNQEQYITVEALNEAVKEGVDKAVSNLPDLPKIGPVSSKSTETLNVESGVVSDDSEVVTGVKVQPNTVVGKGVEPLNSQVASESLNNVSTLEPVGINEVASASEDSSEEDEGSAWTLSRAKQDFKDMLMGFISIKKTDQSDK